MDATHVPTMESPIEDATPTISLKTAAVETDAGRSDVEETRAAVELTAPPPAPTVVAGEVKENRWKLAFRQLMFMKGMNMQVNSRNKNEIELRQQNITPLSLMCSVPFFNSFSAAEIQKLVDASQRVQLRPGDSIALSPVSALCDQKFYIVVSGNLAIASMDVENARAVQQADLSTKFKLGIGDYFAIHRQSNLKVIAMEPVEYLVIPMQVIHSISEYATRQIEADKCEMAPETAERESFKQWALQFTLAAQRSSTGSDGAPASPTAVSNGLAKNTMKQFSRDILLHLSPENELDHTLEHVKNALLTTFGAKRVRMYIVDHDKQELVVKFADETFSKGSFPLGQTAAAKVIETRRAIHVTSLDKLSSSTDGILYDPKDSVLVAPFFEFDPSGASTYERDSAVIVGILEIVLDGATEASASDNDIQILEVATQELGRYLFFHYQDFFTVSQLSGEATEVFPAPNNSLENARRPLTLRLESLVMEAPDTPVTHAVVRVCHGKLTISSNKLQTVPTSPSRDKSTPKSYAFDGVLDTGVSLGDIPHGSHLMVEFMTKNGTSLLAWSGLHLFDFGHDLRAGQIKLDVSAASQHGPTALDIENCMKRDRPGKKNVVGTVGITLDCAGSKSSLGYSFSSVATRKRTITYRASIFAEKASASKLVTGWDAFSAERQRFLSLLRGDPLVALTAEDKQFLWDHRYTISDDSALLPAFLLSVDWSKRDQVLEAYRLLIEWRQPTYLQALQLLSPLYPDPKVRAYAVRCMHSLPDHRLRLYLLQLVQALKNERYHDSALARFLLMRALQNPAEIGYSLYWFLKAEAHVDQTAERFALFMDEYLQLCGAYKLEIRQSVFVMKKLEDIATIVKQESNKDLRRPKLHDALRATVLPETFQLPLQPRTYCTRIIVEPCRVMESKKRPLLLQLESSKAQHGNPFVIFKSGDDLRQDQLVLQILRVMDDLWREAELDLCLSPYGCISTGDELGLIEVVRDSSTLASIIYDRHEGSTTKLGRKLKSASDALLKDQVISEWLFQADDEAQPSEDGGSSPPSSTKNGTPPTTHEVAPVSSCLPPLSPSKLRRQKKLLSRDTDATDNFIRSCAGYCVATYVLGIGDRHNDNIMLQRSGKFFHIDFGHFLGNFKSKFGIKREKAPFVFTPAMLHVIGGKDSAQYTQFQQIACEAFQVLRAHSNLLITLLVLALTCGTPELTCEDDIKWVHRTLFLELADAEASDKFRKLIDVALHTKTTLVNDAVHLMAH